MNATTHTTAATAQAGSTPPSAEDIEKMKAALSAAIDQSIVVDYIAGKMKAAGLDPEKGCLCFVPQAWDSVIKAPPKFIKFSRLLQSPVMLNAVQAGLMLEPGQAFKLPDPPSRIIL